MGSQIQQISRVAICKELTIRASVSVKHHIINFPTLKLISLWHKGRTDHRPPLQFATHQRANLTRNESCGIYGEYEPARRADAL